MSKVTELFEAKYPIVGVISLAPTPGFTWHPGQWELERQALEDLALYEKCGLDGVIIENDRDHPHDLVATPETKESMLKAVQACMNARTHARVGLEVLLNDPYASLDIAKETGADFIRVDYFADRMERPEYGEVEVDPTRILTYRSEIGADHVALLADIQVKHAKLVEPKTIAQSAKDAESLGADAVIVTSEATGIEPSRNDLREASLATQTIPVWIGSGLNSGNLPSLKPLSSGAIVGTAFFGAEEPRPQAPKIEKFVSLHKSI